MDDFLHNLRSGKLKQADRGRRDYSDYKGPQRRMGNDRRRVDYYAKVTSDHFLMLKESLDTLADNQKRIADALEAIALRLGSNRRQPSADQRSSPAEVEPTPQEATAPAKGQGKLADGNQADLLDLIAAMRSDGDSWEKIARHLDSQNVPTISGKGKWRGTAVKKYWDTYA